MKLPKLSIVLQVGGQRDRSTRCLASLLEQEGLDHLEIILLDYGLDAHPPLEGSDHPAVRMIPRPSYEAIGTSRALGVRKAKAPIVAFIEDHCVAFPGWAQGIIHAHTQGWEAIGTEVHIPNAGIGISDAIGVMNYARWLPPAFSGEYDLLVGHNTAYDRKVLMAFGERLADMLRCDPILQWKLQEEGIKLFLDNTIKIGHNNETELAPIMRGYYLWNRVFAPTRAEVFQWPFLRKLVWVILSPLIPPVRIIRQFYFILSKRRYLLGQFFRSIPVQFLAHSAAAAGQTVGLLFGIGEAETDFLHYELNQNRRMVSL